MAGRPPGTIITFYSYKGGTGRTMALANIGCLLGQRQAESKGKHVLLVDWDLEAPGLHRFFRNKLQLSLGEGIRGLTRTGLSPDDALLEERLGLIDLFQELYKASTPAEQSKNVPSEEEAKRLIDNTDLSRFVLQTTLPGLRLLTAGRFDKDYSSRVNTFQWESLYYRCPDLLPAFAEKLGEEYQYVLIDSRTGLTDISGICTMLMPSLLVVVFTPNRQSLTGIQDLVRRATTYRKQSTDLRPLLVFPLASRIETAEKDLRETWRFGSADKDIIGYQRQFENLFKEVYGLSNCDLNDYFDDAVLQHVPRYAYGEELAVLTERAGDRLSLNRTYSSFAQKLIEPSKPWEKHEIAAKISQGEIGELQSLAGKGPSARFYAAIATMALAVAIAMLAFYVYRVPKLVESGTHGQVFYLLLIPWAVAATVFLYFAMRTYAGFTHRLLGYRVELSVSVAIFFLVLLGGFYLVPQQESVAYVVRVFGPSGPLKEGRVTIDLGNNRRTVPISSAGEALFTSMPQSSMGTRTNLIVEAPGYQPRIVNVILSPVGTEIPVETERAPSTILSGVIFPPPKKNEGFRIVVDNQPSVSTVPDESGKFRLIVTGKNGEKVRLKVYDGQNRVVYDDYQVLPGPVTVTLHSSTQSVK
jgi:cellulose biosynthesis protein BcsQ